MTTFEVGNHAPDFAATTCDGNKIRLADFLGKRALAACGFIHLGLLRA